MAKNVTVQGASYTAVPAVDLPLTGGGTARFTDTSEVTALASDVTSGKTFVDANGILQTGTASGGGGGSSWTKVAETTYQVTTSSTSTKTVDTWATGHSELWTKDKWVYVRIRDTAGLRNGYFFGSDLFYYNADLANGLSPSYIATNIKMYTSYSGSTITPTAATTAPYGVFTDQLYPDGRIRIRSRYSSTNSLTIDGTYKVEVYLLAPPTGSPIFV